MSIIISNKLIPVKGFSAINICGLIFVRKGIKLNADEIRHEQIHSRQIMEMLVVFFYLAYVCEWLYLLIKLHDSRKAYMAISFEKEAYGNMHNKEYLVGRKPYSWLSYIKARKH